MLTRKTLTLTVLITLTLWLGGCTVTVESDWPGGWGRKDRSDFQVQYKSGSSNVDTPY